MVLNIDTAYRYVTLTDSEYRLSAKSRYISGDYITVLSIPITIKKNDWGSVFYIRDTDKFLHTDFD